MYIYPYILSTAALCIERGGEIVTSSLLGKNPDEEREWELKGTMAMDDVAWL